MIPNRHPPSDDAELLDMIRGFIAEALDRPVEEIDPDANLYTELGVDSLAASCVFVDLAYHFGTPEPQSEEDYMRMDTARKMSEYVRRHEPS